MTHPLPPSAGEPADLRNPNTGHGHVRPRPDGMKARCGGTALCAVCQREKAALAAAPAPLTAPATMPPEIPRALLGKVIDEAFDGAIEDTSPIEDIYRVIAREMAAPASTAAAVPADTFRGDDAALVRNIAALLALDAQGALVPHGIGGHARSLLESAAARLAAPASTAAAVPAELDVRKILLDVVPGDDGMGLEVYARTVSDVEDRLTKSAARRECADGSQVLRLANGAWQMLVRMGLHGCPLRADTAAAPIPHELPLQEVAKALRRAYQLGQVYWQQADSEYTSQHRKSDETRGKFEALCAETLAALATTPVREAGPAEGVSPTIPTEQQILDAAYTAGLWPNTVHRWIPAFKRYHAALASTRPAQEGDNHAG